MEAMIFCSHMQTDKLNRCSAHLQQSDQANLQRPYDMSNKIPLWRIFIRLLFPPVACHETCLIYFKQVDKLVI